ncbi:MAG: phage holin family protein [Candidatus Shapirobacteria bacterium]
MKKIIREWFIHLIALQAIAWLTGALDFSTGLRAWFLSTLVLTIFSLFLKPLLKLLLLPINLLTLGLLRWVINVAGLILAVYLVEGFQIANFHFAGYSSNGFSISPVNLSLFGTYVLLSFILDLVLIIIRWIIKK